MSIVKSDVYFTDLRTSFDENLLAKLRRLIITAGIQTIDFRDKFTAIKVHFGEPGNLSFLRPNFVKVIADLVKEQGGTPYLTDCNTLYVGGRKNAPDHISAAYENGFTPFSTGCHVIIGDGIKGTDDIAVPIDGEYVKAAKIGRAVMDSDVFISLTHFKGHECTGFGGALKNIGMGCGSFDGKKEMHDSGKPVVNPAGCIGCKKCTTICAHSAITVREQKAVVDYKKCVGCGRCIEICPNHTIDLGNEDANDILNRKIAEYTYAVVKGKPCFHISIVMDVSPFCDCHAENDAAIIPNVGMFASFDPVALDVACADACNKQQPVPNSFLGEKAGGNDHFTTMHPTTNWRTCVSHGAKIGLGSLEYNLIEI